MKRTFSLILALLFAASLIQAQTPETLTNSSVIKMSKANLSEELINRHDKKLTGTVRPQ